MSTRNFDLTQRQLEAKRIRRGNFQIRRNLDESKSFIERLRLAHDWKRVKTHLRVAHRARISDYILDQYLPGTFFAESRPDIQPLHFTDSIFQLAQPNAAD